MSKITIEEIEGKKYTVVWHVFPPKCGPLGKRFSRLNDGCLAVFAEAECMSHIATALPALPRHPTPEDTPLLYRYGAEGFNISGYDAVDGFLPDTTDVIDSISCGDNPKIHDVSYKNWIVEIAITDEAHNV